MAEALEDLLRARPDVPGEQPLQRALGHPEARGEVGHAGAERRVAHGRHDIGDEGAPRIGRREAGGQEVGDQRDQLLGSVRRGERTLERGARRPEHLGGSYHAVGQRLHVALDQAQNPPGLNFVPTALPASASTCAERPVFTPWSSTPSGSTARLTHGSGSTPARPARRPGNPTDDPVLLDDGRQPRVRGDAHHASDRPGRARGDQGPGHVVDYSKSRSGSIATLGHEQRHASPQPHAGRAARAARRERRGSSGPAMPPASRAPRSDASASGSASSAWTRTRARRSPTTIRPTRRSTSSSPARASPPSTASRSRCGRGARCASRRPPFARSRRARTGWSSSPSARTPRTTGTSSRSSRRAPGGPSGAAASGSDTCSTAAAG